jgi:hypothetical protein
MSANATSGYEVIIDFGALGSGSDYVQVSGFDIRVTPGVATGLNSSPPTPEFPPIALELVRNQRYFNTSYGNGVKPGTATNVGSLSSVALNSTNFYSSYIQFPVQMRASPTMTYYSSNTGNSGKWYDGTSSADVANMTVGTNGATGINTGNTGSMTANHLMEGHYTASAEL